MRGPGLFECAGIGAAGRVRMQMIADSLRKLEAGRGLSREEAEAAMEELLAGRLAHGEIVRLLISLRDKGETVDELVGFARAMRRHAVQIFPAAVPSTDKRGQ